MERGSNQRRKFRTHGRTCKHSTHCQTKQAKRSPQVSGLSCPDRTECHLARNSGKHQHHNPDYEKDQSVREELAMPQSEDNS